MLASSNGIIQPFKMVVHVDAKNERRKDGWNGERKKVDAVVIVVVVIVVIINNKIEERSNNLWSWHPLIFVNYK